MSADVESLLRHVIALRAEGRDAIACLMVKNRGSTPQTAGSIMIVDDAAEIRGTVGGGCVEAEIRRSAIGLLSDGGSGVFEYKLDHDYGWDDGLICGGTIRVAVGGLPATEELERIVDALASRSNTQLDLDVCHDGTRERYTLHLPPQPRLYIAGAGHIGQVVAQLGSTLGFDVTVFDDRPDLVARAESCAITGCAGPIAENLANAPIDHNTYCVIVTRGHRHDEQALHAVVNRGARYLGMIGSRRKVKLICDDLVERGVDPEHLADLHAPIGLDIGSVTVNEIAVSIVAELIQVRRTERGPAVVEGPIELPLAESCS